MRNATVSPEDVTERRPTMQTKKSGVSNVTTTTTKEEGVSHMPEDADNMTPGAVSLPSTYTTGPMTNWKPGTSKDHPFRFSEKQRSTLETQNEKAKKNVAKTLAIVTACYFICWMPSKIYLILNVTGVASTYSAIYGFTVILTFINCCINPMIYIGKYDAFRTGLSLLFRSNR